MLHEPAAPAGKDYAVAYKTRLGVWMFICYSIFYAGFVAINLLNATVMEKVLLWGLNLATVYGFALIIVALILAVIYNSLCGRQESILAALDMEGK